MDSKDFAKQEEWDVDVEADRAPVPAVDDAERVEAAAMSWWNCGKEFTMLTNLLATLGPGVTITYIGQEGIDWWAELSLPADRYAVTVCTASGRNPDMAITETIRKAYTYRLEREERAA